MEITKSSKNIGAVERNLDGSFSVTVKLGYPISFREFFGNDTTDYSITALKMRSPRITDNIEFEKIGKSDAKARDAAFTLIYDYECEPTKTSRPLNEILNDVALFDLKNLILAFWAMFTEVTNRSAEAEKKVEYNAISMPTHAWVKFKESSLTYQTPKGETEMITKLIIRLPRAVEVPDDEDNPNKNETAFRFIWSLIQEGENSKGEVLQGHVIRQMIGWKSVSLVDALAIMGAYNQLSEAGMLF